MTENKRFTFIHFDWLQWHIYDNESLLCEVTDDEDAENLCKLLNELHEENKKLKFQLKECREHKLYSRRKLEEENNELKKKLKKKEKLIEAFEQYINDLREVGVLND